MPPEILLLESRYINICVCLCVYSGGFLFVFCCGLVWFWFGFTEGFFWLVGLSGFFIVRLSVKS